MGNLYARTRTNMFHVTDEEKFREIMSHVGAADKIDVFESCAGEQSVFGFGCESNIDGYIEKKDSCEFDDCADCGGCFDGEGDFTKMVSELQTVLPDKEAIIITEVSWEKLAYVGGSVTVITKNAVQVKNMSDAAKEIASGMLGEPFVIIE